MMQNIKLTNKKIASVLLTTLIALSIVIIAAQSSSAASNSDVLPVASISPQPSNPSYTVITSSYCGIPYDLYCPANYSGSLVILAGGILGYKNYLSGWGANLAENGFAALAFTTTPQDLDHVAQYVQDCKSNLQILLPFVFNASAFPIPINQSDVSLVGMSGGGATVLTFSDPRIKTCVAVCPYLVSDLPVQSAVPTLIITGEYDVIAPPQIHGDVYYSLVPASVKMLIQQAKVGHDISDVGWKYTYAWLRYNTMNSAAAYSTLVNVGNDTAISYSLKTF